MPDSARDSDLRHLFTQRLQIAVLKKNAHIPTLATKANIPVSTLRAWVAGKRCPPLGDPRRKALAKALGMTLAWINGLDDQEATDAGAENK